MLYIMNGFIVLLLTAILAQQSTVLGSVIPPRKCGYALGLESGILPDAQIKASSEYNSNHSAANGRINFVAGSGRTGAWSALSNDQKQWLQVDFLKAIKLEKVATQGRSDYEQWVTKYTLSYSRDGVFWSEYLKEFLGNTDRSSILTHTINPTIYARSIRIHPKAWHGHISMRAEFYGCTSGFVIPPRKCGYALGLESGILPDAQIKASTEYNSAHRAANGRINFVKGLGRTGAWSALSNDQKQWLQVDFLQVIKVEKVSTQGRSDTDQWVTKYKLSYSRDGVFWSEYLKEFLGNKDPSLILTHTINPTIYARFIRIHPKAWHGHISMRAEFYGCTSECERGCKTCAAMGQCKACAGKFALLNDTAPGATMHTTTCLRRCPHGYKKKFVRGEGFLCQQGPRPTTKSQQITLEYETMTPVAETSTTKPETTTTVPEITTREPDTTTPLPKETTNILEYTTPRPTMGFNIIFADEP